MTAPNLLGGVSGLQYKRRAPQGFAPWSPRAKARDLVEQVQAVLAEYHVAVMARQVFYRLIGAHNFPKLEKEYTRLLLTLNRGRRSRLIPFEAIRDAGARVIKPYDFEDPSDFWQYTHMIAKQYRRERQEGQDVFLEVWCEAEGMMEQLVEVADPFGIAVYSCGGFDSVTAKHDAAQRMSGRDRETVVLHIGDHDPSGCALVDSANDDIAEFCCALDVPKPRFERVAVTPNQVVEFDLPTAPAKTTDARGNFEGQTVQAEALSPDQLQELLREAILDHLDPDVYQDVLDQEAEDRQQIVALVEDMLEQVEGGAS